MYYCKYCGQEFEKPTQVGSHTRLCKNNPKRDYNIQILRNNGANTYRKFNELRKRPLNTYKCICEKCGNEYEIKTTEYKYNNGKYKKHCSRSCANARIHSTETKEKISKSIRNVNSLRCPKRKKCICKVCNSEYFYEKGKNTATVCSQNCRQYYLSHRNEFLSKESLEKISMGGRKSAQKQGERRRSKNEISFYNLCKDYFNIVLHNEPMFNGWDADIIIEDYKLAILWNGAWHYKEISKKNTLKSIQNRDKIKIKEIEKCGYIPYVIKDMGKYSLNIVKEEFEKLKIYCAVEKWPISEVS